MWPRGRSNSADDWKGIDSNKAKAESSFNQLTESGQQCRRRNRLSSWLSCLTLPLKQDYDLPSVGHLNQRRCSSLSAEPRRPLTPGHREAIFPLALLSRDPKNSVRKKRGRKEETWPELNGESLPSIRVAGGGGGNTGPQHICIQWQRFAAVVSGQRPADS